MQPLIHIFHQNRQEGPYTADQVRAMLDNGTLAPTALAWQEGMAEWAPLSSVLPYAVSSRPLAPPLPPAHPIQQPAVVGPKGVGGWLVVFCIGLTILSPLVSLAQMASTWDSAQAGFSRFPSLKTAVMWENAGTAVLLVYGMVVGCIIWSGHSNGRSVAKTFLVIRLVAFIVVELIAILLMGDLPSEVMAAGIGGVVGAGMTQLIYFLIWWFYFQNSKRVQNTYG
jgi:hypothetical protein